MDEDLDKEPPDVPCSNPSLRQIHGYGASGKLPVEYANRAASDLPYGYNI